MLSRKTIEAQLAHTIQRVEVPGLENRFEGKVRDCYVVGDKRIIIASDRLSAFDVVLTTIPFKGQLLNEMATYWFEQTAHIVKNHVVAKPHPNVLITQEVDIIPIEVVVRGYLAGSAWRDYKTERPISGLLLPKGMRKSERLPEPVVTPSTKAEQGKHDEPISGEEIVAKGLVPADIWQEVCSKALALFNFGTKKAAEQGLILVDTKYEFGMLEKNGKSELVLADEIHTPDSSRYWMLESYQSRFEAGEDPEMLDKEFVRRWLIEQGYMGNGTPPRFTDSFRVDTTLRYVEAYETITGRSFVPETGAVTEKIAEVVKQAALNTVCKA